MNILIPMAGAGQRFVDAGYLVHKPAILTDDYRTGEQIPMAVCAAKDLPGISAGGSNLTFIDRDFHKTGGVEEEILKYFPLAAFITIDKLTEGQACTCMLAAKKIDNNTPLLIAGCDNGMIFDHECFAALTKTCDVIVFTYRNHEAVLENPQAYGYVLTDGELNVTDVSVKIPISKNPMNDHAIVAVFWFRYGHIFVEAYNRMFAENDRVNNEFYVDKLILHAIRLGYKVKAFEVDKYLGWGTPRDYENYQNTIAYWRKFIQRIRHVI